MTTPERFEPKKNGLFTWKSILGILFIVYLVIYFAGGTKSSDSTTSTTTTSQSADLGTRMACEHWQTNLHNASVETMAQQIAGAQKVNQYASISTNPTIVEYGRKMAEDMINQDSEAYLADGTIFGTACQSAGQ